MATTTTDSKGNEIKVGSLVQAKNSNIIRKVGNGASWLKGTQELSLFEGKIYAKRIDGKQVGRSAWLNPAEVEVVG
jgi:hypothetical protein